MAVAGAILAGIICTEATAQTGRIAGTVRDLESGRPLPGARVSVEGSWVNASTDGAGRYQLLSVPPGTQLLRVERPGHATLVADVTVQADALTVANFHMPLLTVVLDELTVTGRLRQDAPERRDVADVDETRVASLAELLSRSAPGLGVVRGSGQVGSGIRIRFGGPKSFSLAGAPLVYIDGVRVEYALSSVGSGVAAPSILDLVDPAMVERIEVLRGAQAAPYGLGAANGVILVTTKGRR